MHLIVGFQYVHVDGSSMYVILHQLVKNFLNVETALIFDGSSMYVISVCSC